MSRSRHPVRVVALALFAIALATHTFIDLELAADLGSWHANAPVADLAALALVPIVVAAALLARGGASPGRWLPPGPAGWALFLVACALSVPQAIDPTGALHHLVRKPMFLYLAYGFALSWTAARLVRPRTVLAVVVSATALTAAVSLAASVGRIAAGDTLWFQQIGGLTPNHKTLAVALAGWLPLLLALVRGDGPVLESPAAPLPARWAAATTILVLAAVLASASKTAWITSAFAVGLFLPRSRPVSLRWKLALPAMALAFALAYYAPVIVGSKAMLDSARSRHSLNERAWAMFAAHPLVGSGTGMNVEIEQVTFPDYRVNGVDAHGVVQKVASETGLLGLVGFGWFTVSTGAALFRRWDRRPEGLDYGALGTWAALHLNLLLSTETFSPTHWVPLAVCWGLSRRGETEPGAVAGRGQGDGANA